MLKLQRGWRKSILTFVPGHTIIFLRITHGSTSNKVIRNLCRQPDSLQVLSFVAKGTSMLWGHSVACTTSLAILMTVANAIKPLSLKLWIFCNKLALTRIINYDCKLCSTSPHWSVIIHDHNFTIVKLVKYWALAHIKNITSVNDAPYCAVTYDLKWLA